MIAIILALIGTVAGFIFGLFDDEAFEGATVLGGISTLVGVIILLLFQLIPFEKEEYLAYTIEMTDFKAVDKSGDTLNYQYTDKDGFVTDFVPSSKVLIEGVAEGFRIETYKTRYTNEHINYLFNVPRMGMYHIAYTEEG